MIQTYAFDLLGPEFCFRGKIRPHGNRFSYLFNNLLGCAYAKPFCKFQNIGLGDSCEFPLTDIRC